MQTILTSGVTYSQLLDDLRAIIRHEVSSSGPAVPTDIATGPELLTVREAAALLDICQQTVHDFARRGLITKHRLGGRVYLKRSELLASLQRQHRTAKPAGKGGTRRA
ncbi:helix-turn-helix domain-containing protein [Hymenobacter aerilatus]|uniref:Helix-turn-helix domain-containing protein n=1 Tax=Hymenobacter aerilatus TaxID=2932251 RepID=A0A8T9SXW1_9BACT|nr:helix-turn-helix domain-containing protein [Hymenobacter aerilatus]UOR06221.1 helix-turn-helix domain-containing protein [Hymenobacter aerilatus]